MKPVFILFWILALVHITPAIIAIAPHQISSLYGIDPQDKGLLTLLQHRAILLGLVGCAFAYAAHRRALRWPVLIMGCISMGLFIVICKMNGQLNGSLGRIALIDLIALLLAALAAFLMLNKKRQNQ